MAKNIIIFSDGTGKEGGKGADSNIYKLFKMVEDRSPRQIVFYDPGLGTDWRKITGSIGGAGISKNIKQCYRFIFEHYEIGDRIFLLGFSRGAATMRSLSSFIHYFGMLPQSRPELIDQAYKIYCIKNDEKRKRKAQALVKAHHTMWVRIQFLGCFDTVAALGLSWKSFDVLINLLPGFRHGFHNFSLSPSVENAYQALAIDDERKTFHPILWDAESLPYQKIKQVWFCGMHSDVGGGYEEHDLSDIPLLWMRKHAKQHGLIFYLEPYPKIVGNVNGYMHDSRGSALTKIYRRKPRHWDKRRGDRPILHSSVLERQNNTNNTPVPPYHPWIFATDYKVEQAQISDSD